MAADLSGGDCAADCGHHEVCIDVVSRAVHCYVCDDYVISDAPWLSLLRSDMIDMETKDQNRSRSFCL